MAAKSNNVNLAKRNLLALARLRERDGEGEVTPILGMEKYLNETIAPQKLEGVRAWSAPGKESRSSTHGGFDDDGATMRSVIGLIRGEEL